MRLRSIQKNWRQRLSLLIGVLLTGVFGSLQESRAQNRSQSRAISRHLSSQKQNDDPTFERILGGSALGVMAGGGIGNLLLKAGAEVDPNRDADPGTGPESEAARAIMGIGLAAVVMGGPVGAVELGGIEHRRRDAYVAAGFGEAIVGILGLVLAGQIHDSSAARLVGLGSGMVLGTAGGAFLVASQKRQDGLFSYQEGDWQIAPPDVRVRPNLTTDRSPSVGVALVSVEL